MLLSWYVMRSKPNKEDFLAGRLQANGLDVFFSGSPCKTSQSKIAKDSSILPELFVCARGFESDQCL